MKLNAATIRSISDVMAASFEEDPLNREMLEGVTKKEKLIRSHCMIQTRHAVKNGTLHLLDTNPGAFLIGVDSKDESRFGDFILMGHIFLHTFLMLGRRDLRTIIANYRRTREVVNFTWDRDFIRGRRYRVKVIAIDKPLRGTGAFRRLLCPIIDYCDDEGIPMVLETHNPRNVGLYNHFGFDLVKTLSSEQTQVRQYCMIKFQIRRFANALI